MGLTELVQHRHLDYEFLIQKDQSRKAMRWCEEQWGPRWEAIGNRTGVWSVFWAGFRQTDQYRFCFVHEQDMVLFALKWA